MTAPHPAAFVGIVLAGGAARRLAGVDKPMLEVAGEPLLRTAVAAVADAEDIVVVGPQRAEIAEVRWVREDPPGSGPVAAVAAGLRAVLAGRDPAATVVAVLAGDLPGVRADTVRRLRDALGERDGAVLIDPSGRPQWLVGVWRADALAGALPDRPAGAALHRTLRSLSIVEVSGGAAESADVDTPEDLARARALHSRHTADPGS